MLQNYWKLNWVKMFNTFWVFHNKENWRISVRLSDRSLCREEQKKFSQKFFPVGWNPQPPDHQSNVLPTALGRNLLDRRFLKWALFVSCTTSHVGLCSFLESIEHGSIKAIKATECWHSSVGRALDWWSGGPGFQPNWGRFLLIFFLLFPVKICQIVWQKGISWKTRLYDITISVEMFTYFLCSKTLALMENIRKYLSFIQPSL